MTTTPPDPDPDVVPSGDPDGIPTPPMPGEDPGGPATEPEIVPPGS